MNHITSIHQRNLASPCDSNSIPGTLAAAYENLHIGLIDQAREYARKALEIAPEDERARKIFAHCELVLAARAMVSERFEDEADWLFARAIELQEASPTALIQWSECLFRRLRFADALPLARRAMNLLNKTPEAVERVAMILLLLGRATESEELLRSRLAAPGGNVLAIVLARVLIESGKADRAVELVESLPEDSTLPWEARANIECTFGHSLEKVGRPAEAFAAYQRMHAARMHAAMLEPFDIDDFESEIDFKIIDANYNSFEADNSEASRSQLPIFVCAMPRSGTTLLERVLVAHQSCYGIGESNLLTAAISEHFPSFCWTNFSVGMLHKAGFKVREKIRITFLERLAKYSKKASRVVDKNVDNWLKLGAIGILFPRAQLIVLRRDPIDLGLSIWSERLDPRIHRFASRLDWIGRTIRKYAEMVAILGLKIPNPSIEIHYENLTTDPGPTIRRLLSFLGLDWDDRCLRHHEEDPTQKFSGSPTISYLKASRPISMCSIGRAEAFGALLDPLRVGLRANPK
jgi:tetratricopeptide (TPR) repeat protein